MGAAHRRSSTAAARLSVFTIFRFLASTIVVAVTLLFSFSFLFAASDSSYSTLYSDELRMATVPATTYLIRSSPSVKPNPGLLHQLRCPNLKIAHPNPLRAFSGLKATTSTSFNSESSFLGRDGTAALKSTFEGVAQKKSNSSMYRLNLQASASYKVAILGAAGGIGQLMSLLIKMSPLVSDLHLYWFDMNFHINLYPMEGQICQWKFVSNGLITLSLVLRFCFGYNGILAPLVFILPLS